MADERRTGELQLQPGMLVGGGKFALLRRIGAGGMGEVFEAEDTTIGRRVALKVLSAHNAGNAEMLRRFQHEAKAVAAIVHPNVVTLYEFGQRSNGAFFIVQELLAGSNLRELLQRYGKLELGEVLEILVPIMIALVATHSKSIIHRDIKPENIFLTTGPDGAMVPKLIDFGIAKMDTGGIPLTLPGVVLGTPLSVCPELLLGNSADVRVDVWAIGAVMFEMLAGVSPFEGPTVKDVLFNILEAPVPRIDAVLSDVPRELGDILERALERDVDARYGSMRDFLRAVLAFAEQHDPTFASRHAGLMASVGLKSTPPSDPQAKQLSIHYTGAASSVFTDETLQLEVPLSVRKPIWPLARVEAVWERPTAPATDSDECVDAAQQALRINALQEAVSHAEQAITRFHAEGAVRGEMRLVQAIAYRWLGDFGESERHADEAMQSLAPKTVAWFAAVTQLGTASGCLGKNERVEALARDLFALNIGAWNGHYVATLCCLTIMLVRGGAIELAQQLFHRARALSKGASAEVEPAVRAALDLAHAEFALHAGDPTMHLRRVESALGHFAAIGDARSACLQRGNIGNAYMQLGAYAQAERLLREAIRVGEPMKLSFITPLRLNIGFALARLGDLDQALEIERTALKDCMRQGNRRYEAFARIYLSEILSLRGDLSGAEHEARTAIDVAATSPDTSAHAAARLASSLLRQGRVLEAFEHAKRAMDTLEQLDGVEEGEALIRLVYVMALDATDRPRSASERLAGARQRLKERVERIKDLELRKSFTENVPEHALTFNYVPRRRSAPPPR